MSYEPFEALGDLAESVDLEFKRAAGRDGRGEVPTSFFETYSAMANSNGGTVLLGVEDPADGSYPVPVGVRDPDKVIKSLFDSLNDRNKVSVNLLSDRHVARLPVGENAVIAVTIPRAKRAERPVYIGQNPLVGTFRRNATGDYRCDAETVRRMIAEQVEDSRDQKILVGFDLRDLDQESIKSYRASFRNVKATHPWNDLEDGEFLRMLGCWAQDRQDTTVEGLTLAGLLMFGKLPAILQGVPQLCRGLPRASRRSEG